jgi:hypothetical protein
MENTNDARKKEWEPDKNKKRASAAALIDAYVDEYRTDREQHNRRENHRVVREWLTIIFLFVAASAGIVQACIFIGQLHEMEKVYGPIKTSAEAAKIAADAAKDSAETTKIAMQLDQRAWLGIEAVSPEPPIPEIGKTFIVRITIKNTGKTPARKIISRGRGEPIRKDGKPNFSYEAVEPFSAHLMPGVPASTLVAPMGVPGANTSMVVNKPVLDALADGTIAAFVHGRFEYEDIFGKPHWVTYCASLFIPFNGQFTFCADHNDTDDNQAAQK